MAPRLVLVHGFTQTGRSWAPLLPRLGARLDVRTPDVPGHGARSQVQATMWEAADLLAAECGEGRWLGYSMGGRLALHVALAHPALVERLVLVGTTAGIDDPRDRAERRRLDDERAARLERDGLDAFLAEWLAAPLFATLDPASAGMDARRENTAAGLAASLRLAGTGAQEPLWARLGELAMPVLCVAGGRDERFATLAGRMAAAIGPNAVVATVPGAGHAAHLERPVAFLAAVLPFLLEDG